MAEVRFSAEAIMDIEEIHAFIAQDSIRYADHQVRHFYATTDRLVQHPLLGKMVPELLLYDVREVVVGKYRMMYRILEPGTVEVMIIHHSARRFPAKRALGMIAKRRHKG